MEDERIVEIERLLTALADAVYRVFPDGNDGDNDMYDFLLQHYHITEEEDYHYICFQCVYDDDAQDGDIEIVSSYTLEEQIDFLRELLRKYRSNSVVYS